MTPHARKRKAKQRQAQRRIIRVLKKHGHKCHWCHKTVVCAKEIPKENLIEIKRDWIIFRDESGNTFRKLQATVDHVTPVSEGGDSKIENLVPSCGGCNRDRQAKFMGRCCLCLEYATLKKTSKLRACFGCRRHMEVNKKRARSLSALGWEMVIDDEMGERWISPGNMVGHSPKRAMNLARKHKETSNDQS